VMDMKVGEIKSLNPDAFDVVLVGGSIHAGKIQTSIRKFCEKYEPVLLKKHLGLFICCMDNNKAMHQFDNAFPLELRTKALAKGLLGGEFTFEKMNWIEKRIIHKISGISKSVSRLNKTALELFIQPFNLLSTKISQ